jgi:hypothetical protein
LFALIVCGTILGLLETISGLFNTVCAGCGRNPPQAALALVTALGIWWPLLVFIPVWLHAAARYGADVIFGESK